MTYDPDWTLETKCVKCSHRYGPLPMIYSGPDDQAVQSQNEFFISCLHDLGWTTEPEVLCPNCQPVDEETLAPLALLQFTMGLLFMALVLAAVIYGWGLSL